MTPHDDSAAADRRVRALADSLVLRPGPAAAANPGCESVPEPGWRELEAGEAVVGLSGSGEGVVFVDEGERARAMASAVRVAGKVPERVEPLPIAPQLPQLWPEPGGDLLLGLRLEAEPALIGSEALRRAHYHARVRLAREQGLRRLVVVVPLTVHEARADRMGPAAYVQQVHAGALRDAGLTLALQAGLTERALVETERGWVVVMAWENPSC